MIRTGHQSSEGCFLGLVHRGDRACDIELPFRTWEKINFPLIRTRITPPYDKKQLVKINNFN